ncbi:hypothetical protein FE257_000227 [Aspergillus nanangensis]|uniref:C3H1-type domain-containing protein n=1 Tax=Aspergillus nanangensis TaxID=2582783 RepID=A0AAD4D0R2_ASPNN|nr:hypothetical protein FE257_000227 [Aspergillus nanangensis]
MLAESEIQALDGNLGAAVREIDNLQNLMEKFRSLLDNYNTLKSDYEEEKEAREKYKKLARGQDRNPFVLVLVDGDGYLFKDHLIKAGSEGGITAAALLSDSIKDLLHDQLGSQAEQCRIMVRIYSNILGLSKQLARCGLLGNEARSLSPFAASFTRSRDLFDYIDAGDKKEGADFKIREMFGLFADNHQCKHIYFAGCHDQGYLSLLTPYRGKADRITLLKAASYHPEFNRLALPTRELPDVFMSTPTGGSTSVPPPQPPTGPSSRQVCKHFQKGICKFGEQCNKLHVMPTSKHVEDTVSRPWISAVKSRDHEDTASRPWTSSIKSREHDYFKIREQDYYAKYLPRITEKAQNSIAINLDDERVDTFCPMPSQEAWDSYSRRAKRQRICNKLHLGGQCGDLSCEYDHSPVDDSILHVMRYIMLQHLCSGGEYCRFLQCYLGHHCQKDGCKGTKPCRFNRHAHTLDLTVWQWIAPINPEASSSPITEHSFRVDDLSTDPDHTYPYTSSDDLLP